MNTLLYPIKILRKTASMVDGLPAVFEQTFIHRRYLCTHVRYMALTVSCPRKALYSDQPRIVEGGSLWYDDDNQEIREINRPQGIYSAPVIDDVQRGRLEFILESTARAWSGRDWDPDHPNDVMERLGALTRRKDPRVARFLRTSVKTGLYVKNLSLELDTELRSHTFNMSVMLVFVNLLEKSGLTITNSRWRIAKVNGLRTLLAHFVVEAEDIAFHLYTALAPTINE